MAISIQDQRPPFVRFEEREVGIDAVASEAAGRPIPRTLIMACITPHGSKDVVEKVADEWLAQIKSKALRGEYPLEWSNFFRAQFDEWKKGNELPREGTPIKTWAMITREAGQRMIALGITTVEDLAAFPDSNVSMIGMDGRYWRDVARGWIDEAKDKGANAKALADANVEITNLKNTIASQSERIARLEAKLTGSDEHETEGEQERPRRGRPPKVQAA